MTDRVEDKQKAKEQILHLLKMEGPQTAAQLAEGLGLSPMAIRQHLQGLRGDRWVTYQEERRPLGRPVKLWQLTDQARVHFPNSHADLVVDLLKGVEALFGEAGLTQLIAERTQRQIQHYSAPLPPEPGLEDWRSRVGAIARWRSQEGYMAEVIDQGETLLLVENHCPICAAAQTCSKLCASELDVFRTVLGPEVAVERVEHLLQGDRRCAYRITRRSA